MDFAQSGGRTAVKDLAAFFAGARADVDDPVGAADDVDFMLDDEERIAGALEGVECVEQRFRVGGMKSGGGLVEDIDDAEEVGMHLRGEAQALQFAWRKRGGGALHGEIAEAEEQQRVEARDDVLGDAQGDGGFFRRGRRGEVLALA